MYRDGSMNALAEYKYTNKKCHAHSDMHSIYNMTTLFNNHPYTSVAVALQLPLRRCLPTTLLYEYGDVYTQ